MPRQTMRADSNRLDALVPGWAMEWMAENTAILSAVGITGLAWPLDTSHNTVTPLKSTALICRDEETRVF
jgi:hypothetical protein